MTPGVRMLSLRQRGRSTPRVPAAPVTPTRAQTGHVVVLALVLGLFAAPPSSAALDPTPPVITAAVTGTLGSNGWYRSNVTIDWTESDPESGITDTTGCDTLTLTQDTTGTGVTCSAANGVGLSGSYTVTVKLDKTVPTVTAAAPARAPDANGWFNHPVSFSFTGSDATSGLDSCAPATYSGPDSTSASITGTCRDKAGNSASRAFPLAYDATAPTVAAPTPGREPDANGWYNHDVTVAFSGSDAVSGLDSCTSPTYTGPDRVDASVTGSCQDRAGNSAARSFAFKYDETAPSVSATPSRTPDANGWYNHALTVSFAGSDATSGIESCAAPTSYSGPDSGAASLSGSCQDRAGNSAARSFGLKYDATAPSVSATPSRTPDANGWYNHALTVSFAGSDATSGIESCAAPASYSGPDSGAASLSGSCQDRAGNSAARSFGLKYDATPPTATAAAPARPPDSNGWYNHPVAVSFSGTDPLSGIDSCSAPTFDGPDSAQASLAGTCSDKAGNVSGAASFELKYDATPPEVTGAAPERGADRNGWYNHPVTVSFSGTDELSGIETCAPLVYSGPDSAHASVAGGCRDVAGNPAGAFSFPMSYDATAPSVRAVPDRRPDRYGWYAHDVQIAFVGADAASGIASCDSFLYGGPNSERASARGGCVDQAGNSGSSSFVFKYSEPLLSPKRGTQVAAAPLLDWVSVTDARHYNLQVWHKGVKLLSVWPTRSSFRLRRIWMYKGKQRRLAAGELYEWYVWPKLPQGYGKPIGRSSFRYRPGSSS